MGWLPPSCPVTTVIFTSLWTMGWSIPWNDTVISLLHVVGNSQKVNDLLLRNRGVVMSVCSNVDLDGVVVRPAPNLIKVSVSVNQRSTVVRKPEFAVPFLAVAVAIVR